MKFRYDFVTNSSSTSYIIYLNQKIASQEKIRDFIRTVFDFIQDNPNSILMDYINKNSEIFSRLEDYLITLSKKQDLNKLDNWILEEGDDWDWELSIFSLIHELDNLNKLPKDWLRCKFFYS